MGKLGGIFGLKKASSQCFVSLSPKVPRGEPCLTSWEARSSSARRPVLVRYTHVRLLLCTPCIPSCRWWCNYHCGLLDAGFEKLWFWVLWKTSLGLGFIIRRSWGRSRQNQQNQAKFGFCGTYVQAMSSGSMYLQPSSRSLEHQDKRGPRIVNTQQIKLGYPCTREDLESRHPLQQLCIFKSHEAATVKLQRSCG